GSMNMHGRLTERTAVVDSDVVRAGNIGAAGGGIHRHSVARSYAREGRRKKLQVPSCKEVDAVRAINNVRNWIPRTAGLLCPHIHCFGESGSAKLRASSLPAKHPAIRR